MLVSTKGRYALRVMLELAQDDSAAYLPLPAIAERQCISEKYLESIVKLLARSGDLFGMRGKGGGYPFAARGIPQGTPYEPYRRLRTDHGTAPQRLCRRATVPLRIKGATF